MHIQPPWYYTRVVRLVKFVIKPPDITVTAFMLFLFFMAYWFLSLGCVYIKLYVPQPFGYLILLGVFILSWVLGEKVETWDEKDSQAWAIKGAVIHILLLTFYIPGSTFIGELIKFFAFLGNRM